LVQIGSIGWETEIVILKIDISDNNIFNFYVDAERKTMDCCTYSQYNEITIRNTEFELDNQTEIYKILCDFKSDNNIKAPFTGCGPTCLCNFNCGDLILYNLNVSWTWEYLGHQRYRIAPIN
tara:strand:- start:46 stop:411 length:366 start_codon:yes stop_codon:yes gene_type:complete